MGLQFLWRVNPEVQAYDAEKWLRSFERIFLELVHRDSDIRAGDLEIDVHRDRSKVQFRLDTAQTTP